MGGPGSVVTDASFGLIDALILVGIVGAAAVGIWFLFSPEFQEKKRREWDKPGGMGGVAEWGEWLLAVIVVAVLVGVGLGMWLRG